MSYFVYILHSEIFDRFYIGQTNNLTLRLKQHNAGYVHSTKPYRPWYLFYFHKVETRSESLKLERSLKNMKSRKRLLEWIERRMEI